MCQVSGHVRRDPLRLAVGGLAGLAARLQRGLPGVLGVAAGSWEAVDASTTAVSQVPRQLPSCLVCTCSSGLLRVSPLYVAVCNRNQWLCDHAQ